jgi:hypothetical protein
MIGEKIIWIYIYMKSCAANTASSCFGRYIGNGNKRPGESAVLRNSNLKEGDDLIKDMDGLSNLKVIFERNVKSDGERPFLGSRSHRYREDTQTVEY